MENINVKILLDMLLIPENQSNERFGTVVQMALSLLDISDTDICCQFEMSRPSLNRWKNGKAAPHPYIRPHVFKYFRKVMEEKFPSANDTE